MIIYGWRAKQLGKEIVHDDCRHCRSRGTVEVNVFQKYAHVFWIPFFPIGKTAVSQCSHCKETLQLKEMPDNYKNTYQVLKKNTRIPAYMFIGLVLIGGLIILGIVVNKQKNKKIADRVRQPLRGDIYEMKISSDAYTICRIEKVTADSVFFISHLMQTNKSSGLSGLKDNPRFDNELQGISKQDLAAWDQKGMIWDIERSGGN